MQAEHSRAGSEFRRLGLQRGNSVGQTEFLSEEPAYHDVHDVTDQ